MKTLLITLILSMGCIASAGDCPCLMYAHSLNRRVLELQNLALAASKEEQKGIEIRLSTNKEEVMQYYAACKADLNYYGAGIK